MPKTVDDPSILQLIAARQQAARTGTAVNVTIAGESKTVEPACASPADWRDHWIYFLLTDRFNNPSHAPAAAWNQKYGKRQGGTFEGIRQQLGYLKDLGVGAIWISPVFKNTLPPDWEYTYTNYNTQDYLSLEARFASDGTLATAERELEALVREAHQHGIYVILDMVLNHAGRVFDYVIDGNVRDYVKDQGLIHCALGTEPPIQWIDGSGTHRSDWTNDPPTAALGPDDAVWPADLHKKEFWRRRGDRLTDSPPDDGYIPGDFGVMRQLVTEYDASDPSQFSIRQKYGVNPVLNILIRCYQYVVAKYDFDAMRIDTTKYPRPEVIETFGNAMREFALTIGKKNFYTCGEVWETDNSRVESFVGRHTPNGDGLGIDAALDFPFQAAVKSIVKGPQQSGVEDLRNMFLTRKKAEEGRISSHGEAGRYFVSFLENHDMHERFNHSGTPLEQVTMALGLLFTLQGIPCLYYGTERGLTGTIDALDSYESVREALWGMPNAFGKDGLYPVVQELARLRRESNALRYGRLYFREVAGNGSDFGLPTGAGGIVAFSRVVGDEEVLVVANMSTSESRSGVALVDLDIAMRSPNRSVRFSNKGTTATSSVLQIQGARFWSNGQSSVAACVTAALPFVLAPMELQIIA